MRFFKKLLIILIIVFVIIQFFRPEKNISAQTSRNDITTIHPMPGEVKAIMSKACFDCHSNNTRYPWYAEIQPVAWWLADHVEEGKGGLNFSEFAAYSPRKQYRKLEEAEELVKEKEMPLASYTWIHNDARLSDDERRVIADWFVSVREKMKSEYPADSLKRLRR